MMYMLKLSLWRTKRQLLPQLLLALQLVFLFSGILFTVSALQEYAGTISLLQRIEGIDSAYYWTIDDVRAAYSEEIHDGCDDGFENLERRMMETGLFRGIGNMQADSFKTLDGSYELQIYSETMAENIRLPLKQGEWFRDDTHVGIAEMIVDGKMAEKYPVGSTVEATFTHVDWETGDDSVQTVSFQVTGVLDMRGFMFHLYSGGNALTASDFFSAAEGYAIIKANAVEFANDSSLNTRIVFPNDGMTAAEEGRAFDLLRTTGDALPFCEIADRSMKFMLYRIGYEFPLNLMLILLGLLGLAGSMIVSHMMSRRENAIYLICGIRWRSLIGIEWIRCEATAVIACALALALSQMGIFRGFFDGTTYLLSIGIAEILIAVGLAISSTQIFAANPVDELRRND